MDIDALAREAVTYFEAGDVTWERFPPYLRRHVQSMRERHGDEAYSERDDWLRAERVERIDERHAGGLDAYFYRIEPTASGLMLAFRGEAIVYAVYLGRMFHLPSADGTPLFERPDAMQQLVSFAIWQALGDVTGCDSGGGSWSAAGDGPIHMRADVPADRFRALDDAARERLVRDVTDVMRDYVRLLRGAEHPATLNICAEAPERASGVATVAIGGDDGDVLVRVTLFGDGSSNGAQPPVSKPL